MKILLVEDCDEVRQLYVMLLDNIFDNVEITESISGNNAVLKLKEKSFDLILCDYEMPGGNGDVVYYFIKDNNIDSIFILFTSKDSTEITERHNFPEREGKDFFISKSNNFNEFKQRLISIASNYYTAPLDEGYRKVRIYNFWKFNKALCDIYLRLSNQKYVKIIHSGDSYTRKDIEKYAHKNQNFLYINAEDYQNFSVTLGQTPFLSYVDTKNPENATVTVHAMIHELVQSVGINETAIKMAEKTVANIVEMAKDDKNLYAMILRTRDKRDYLYDHSYLLSCLCGHLAWQMNWSSIKTLRRMNWSSAETLRKITLASIFHDLTLDNPDLAMINDLDDPALQNFTEGEIKKFKDHPSKMAELLRQHKTLPPDVDHIVLQHHEKVDGTGFPRKLSAKRISPLSCIFIIAHDFVDELYKCDFDETNIIPIMEKFAKKYNSGNFKDPIHAFIRSFDVKIDIED